MTATQKGAWYLLAVNLLTVLMVLTLIPFLGPRPAMAGLALFALTAFHPLFFRKKPGRVVDDERETMIRSRSILLAYSVFWAIFVLAAVFLSASIYGWEGAVPVWIVQHSVWAGWLVVSTVWSIAILAQYRLGTEGSGDADA